MTSSNPLALDLVRAAASMVPTFGGAIDILITRAYESDRRRIEQVLTPALEAAGSIEQLLRRLERDEALEVLFTEAIATAGVTAVEGKRRFLAKVLRNALADEAVTDETHLVVAVLKVLDGPHIRALARLEALQTQYPGWDIEHMTIGGQYRTALYEVWDATLLPVRAALLQTGVAHPLPQVVVFGAKVEGGISDFGLTLLRGIREAGVEEL